MDHIRLSVIVPSLTGEVPESLRAQVTGRADVELVVVKGVSPIGKARNVGLARAKGDYIAWVDADDDVADDWLDAILKKAERNPDVMVLGYSLIQYSGASVEMIWRGDDILNDVLQQKYIYSQLWQKVSRRELWTGVRFDDAARILEDWEVLPQILMSAKNVVAITRPLYRYFLRKESLTHQVDESMQREVFERAVGRVAEVKRLGLWKKYGLVTLSGVADVVYGDALLLALSGGSDSPTKRDAEHWLRWRLPMLLVGPASLKFKARWLLASFGWWGVMRWYRVRIRGMQSKLFCGCDEEASG